VTKDKLKKLFKNEDLFNLALTHKSWVNEHPKHRESNERAEFLGDAVLEYVVSKELYSRFPKKEEGYLTALRANLVNTVNLAEIAKNLSLGEKLYLSKGEEDSGGRNNPSILADTVEAVIGALFLDGGIDKAEDFIQKHLLAGLEKKLEKPLKDAKSRLQELVQAQGKPTPRYSVVSEEGPDHAKVFTIEVKVDGETLAVGKGKNKSEAAQEAASTALEKLS
jgi:ribonuclease-3